jgi:hypothetical protein
LTGLTATVPAELTVLSAEPTGNFSAALQRDGSGNVVGIRWSGGSSARPLRFSFRAKTVGEAARITIPVVQSFADGSTTAWDTARTTVLGSDSASQHTPLEAVAQVRDAGDRSRVKVSVTNSTGSAITSVTVSVSEALRDARMLPSDTMDIQEIRSAGGRLVAATLTGQIPPGGNLEFGLTASVTNPATLSGSVTLADGTLRAFETNRIGSSDSNLQRIGVASAALVAILVTAALSYWRVRKRRA